MRDYFALAAAFAGLVIPATAQAQTANSWTGLSIGARAGFLNAQNDRNERILFDNNLDGTFGDTVRNAAGADAFTPGFCSGAANDRTPAAGCRKDKDGGDYAITIGFDQQLGGIVAGLVTEAGRASARDSVSAFSSTPAFYTMTRRLRDNAAVRGRVGIALGDTLPYVTGGIAVAKLRRSFATSNTVNTFTQSGDRTVTGPRLGGGVEQRFGRLSVGAVYLYTNYKDDDARVRTAGPAPATNAFILVNPNGTDFARSNTRFKTESISGTVSLRF